MINQYSIPKFLYSFTVIFLTTVTAICQRDPIDVQLYHQLSAFQYNEYFTLTIRLKNISSDSIYYWMQNWKVKAATNNGQNIFTEEPIGKGAVSNSLFFFDNRVQKSKKHSSITDNYYSDFKPECDLLKLIPPEGVFIINLVIQDSNIINLINKTPDDQLRIKYYYAYKFVDYQNSFLEKLGAQNELDIFYDSDLLTILFSESPDSRNIECPCNLLNPSCISESITKQELGLIASQLTQARRLLILK